MRIAKNICGLIFGGKSEMEIVETQFFVKIGRLNFWRENLKKVKVEKCASIIFC